MERYPEVVVILPNILAVRDKKLDVLDLDSGEFKNIEFKSKKFNKDEIINFCKEFGLLDMFSHIDDLYSYLVGTQVGLDTHARKNRSGKVFEDIVGKLLAEKIKDKSELRLGKEDTIPFERTKRWDHVIYKHDDPVIFFECNFYNASGSKPIEVAHTYADLQKQLAQVKASDITLLRQQITTLEAQLTEKTRIAEELRVELEALKKEGVRSDEDVTQVI